MTSTDDVTRLTMTNIRADASRAHVPVIASSPYEGMSMTSTNTKRLNRSAVSTAPHTPPMSMSVSAG